MLTGLVSSEASLLADDHLLPVSSHGFLFVCLCPNLLFYEDTSHIALGLIHMTSFYLKYLFKEALSWDTVTFQGTEY